MVGKTPREKGHQATVQKSHKDPGRSGGHEATSREEQNERVSSRPTATGRTAAARGKKRLTKRKRAEQEEERERAEESRKRARDKMWKSWSSSGKVGEDEAREHKGTGSGAKNGAEPPD